MKASVKTVLNAKLRKRYPRLTLVKEGEKKVREPRALWLWRRRALRRRTRQHYRRDFRYVFGPHLKLGIPVTEEPIL